MNLEQLRKRQAEITARQNELVAAAKADGGVFSDEAREEFDKLDTEHAANVTAIADLEKKAQEDAQRIRAMQARKPLPSPRQTQSGSGVTVELPNNTEPQFVNDPNKGFTSPREFIGAVIQAGRGYTEDQRLKYLTVGSDEARTNSDPAGGFLVPVGYSPDVLKIMPEDDPMGGLTTKMPMERPIIKLPARADKNHSSSVSGGLTVTRRPETVAATASQMTLEQVTMEAHSLFGLSYATEELLTDSPTSFAAILAAGFSDQFTGHLVNERLVGTGVGEFQGVIGAACTISVSKETGQAAATIVKENLDKMAARCYGFGKAVWVANHNTRPQLSSLSQAVGTGGALVPYFTFDPNTGKGYLLGRPIIFSEFAKTLGTVGDIVLGNWSEYLEGVYQPLQSAESVHVRFVNHERAFKFWTRNAGVPWWKSALTPKNGDTLSPFVTLATRA
jgi:HK97 family phage major capsid protein